MWNRIKGSIIRFLSGRYGMDSFNRFLLYAYLAVVVIGIFADSILPSLLGTVIALTLLFRMLSRNRMARMKENRAYLKMQNAVIGWFRFNRDRIRDRKTHIYRKCPSCRAVLRLPRTSGEHTVKCPRCANRFSVKVK